MLNEGISARVHVTTSNRGADVRATSAIADRLQARVTVANGGLGRTVLSTRERLTGWILHHRGKGGVGEVIRQLAVRGPQQAKQMAKRGVRRRGRASMVPTPTIDSVDPPTDIGWHILVGLSLSELRSKQAMDLAPDADRVIQLVIGPKFWWGEPWQPALAHRNVQLLLVSATVTGLGRKKGHLVRYLTVATDDTAISIAKRYSAVAADVCASLVLHDPPLSPGDFADDSPLSERMVAHDTTTFDSAVWTDLTRSITRF